MKLELEDRGNVHTETVWFEIIDEEASLGDEGNTIATMAGFSDEYYQIGRLLTAAPDLLTACTEQQILIEKLLALYSPRNVDAQIPSSIVENVKNLTRKAISKAKRE